MKMQTKTLLIIGLAFVGLIGVLYAASQVIALGSFSEQENRTTLQNIERVESALADNIRSLEGTTRDWSLWDDTFDYIQDKNDAYFNANLLEDTPMSNNRLNLMLFVDLQGRIVYQKSYDYAAGMKAPSPEGLQQQIYPNSPLLHHTSSQSSITGILALPRSPLLIASEPIMRSDSSGAIQGTLIFGRLLDTEQIKHLAKTTLLTLTFTTTDAPQLPDEFKQLLSSASASPSTESPIVVRTISDSTVAGYTLLKDVYGKPALILKAEMPRDVYAQGQDAVRYYIFILVATAALFGLVTLLLLKKTLLSRLARLNHDTEHIAASGDMSARVAVAGNDELSHLAGSMNDMLQTLQRTHEELKEGEARYRAVVEQTSEAIFLVDMETRHFVQANAAFQTLLGYSRDELREITLDDIVQPDMQTTSRLFNTTGSLGLPSEHKYRRKDGSVVPVEVSDSHIKYGGRDVLCMVARDITDRKRAETLLRELAMRDGLTGLYNRRELQRILKEADERYQRYGEGAALIMIDMDHFKSVNDTYGHQVGDDVLRWISHLLPELVRSIDKVARYGGEELAVILPGATIESASFIAEHLRTTIAAQPFEFIQTVDDTDRTVLVSMTISVGVAALSEHIESVEALIEAADQALYEAKRAGRNCTRIYHTISSELREIS